MTPKRKITFDTVRDIALTFPGVTQSAAYGVPALKVHGKLLACIPTNRAAEPDSIAVRVDLDDRAELLQADPAVYYVPDHYLAYPSVLVRLSRVNPDALRDLLGMAYKYVTREVTPTSSQRKPRARKPPRKPRSRKSE